jgi:hypothetical protein
MTDTTLRPDLVLQCVGFYGFGGGWLLARMGIPGEMNNLYCNTCPAKKACFDAHKTRVRLLDPDTMAEYDQLASDAAQNGVASEDIVMHVVEAMGIDPLMMVATGNVEDGFSVGNGGKPEWRGPFTVPYPFVGRMA